ncbi:MaoC family dehydratase [Candidatus Aquiluna sp. UB-MaderosW2red]|uniref:MaoC family dehydratase n=1 Tax=Candidatus Aquiluna sp. UB-MaderosW2red TaxID=1855377 RepID=UPI000875BBB6|nr:MaoC family dehydratase [Candidatus Aquiluna sp. UB-MaderosW2red]SCX15573.1 Acyl dehydratase [Candidatus Aquiluna sp. UB-MaderosW2red]
MADYSKLEIGEVIAEESFSLTRDSLVRYAGASGDFNTIHYRDDIAESVGLPGVLAHGMLTMGLAIQPVVAWLGDAGKIIDYGVRFTRPVVVPANGEAVLLVIAKVAALEEETRRVRIDLTVTFEENTVLGKAQVWVQL